MHRLTFRHLLAALTAALGLTAATAGARSPVWRPKPAAPAFAVSVEDERGAALPTFRHEGQVFVLGTPGERYNVRVVNRTGRRVEAVVSVDGRDAISGQVGDFVSQRGYVVPAFGSVLIEGFRRSLDEVAAFRFTDPRNSYSARRGTPQNVGVIGVAFFSERPPPREVAVRPAPHKARSAEAPSADGAPRGQAEARPESARARRDVNNLGTEFGERQQSAVVEVSFERQNPTRPSELLSLRYDDASGLEARGIDLSSLGRRFAREPREPEPFPLSRFAQPPR
jgi:hypothetical protein